MADSVFSKTVKSGALVDPLGLARTTTKQHAGMSAANAFAELLSARMQANNAAVSARKTPIVRTVVPSAIAQATTSPSASAAASGDATLPLLGAIVLRSTEAADQTPAVSEAETAPLTSVTANSAAVTPSVTTSTTEGTTTTSATTSVSSDAIANSSSTTEGTTATTPPENTTSAKAASAPDFDAIMQTIFRHEGSRYVGSDAGGESSKYGILQSTAKENGYVGDIRNITQDQAKEVYRKIWNKSGAAQMSSDLSLVYFDSYINHPASAKRFLAQSGGDIDTMLQLRETRYQELAATKPERFGRYLKGWTNRITSLRTAVGAQPVVAETGDTSTLDA